MGKGRICIWIIRPVVTAPAFLPLQRCPGDQSADLCQIFQLYQFSQTPAVPPRAISAFRSASSVRYF